MARTRFVPEAPKLERRYGRDDDDFKTAGFDHSRTEDEDEDDDEPKAKEVPWEMLSVANFVEDKLDNDCDTFTGGELQQLAAALKVAYPLVKDQLISYGLSLACVKAERTFRTFGDNPHNRWMTEDAKRMSGGGGGSSIMGMAGRVG